MAPKPQEVRRSLVAALIPAALKFVLGIILIVSAIRIFRGS